MIPKKLMLVDDDRYLLVGLTARLQANGYQVVSATDAISAISVARKEAPDLIILDLGLPGGDGFTVLERLASLKDIRSAPTIVLSARDANENEDRALKAGAVAFFQKPANSHDFLSAVRHALGEKTALSAFLSS